MLPTSSSLRRALALFPLVLAALSSGGAAVAHATSGTLTPDETPVWSQFQGDPAHTGTASPSVTPPEPPYARAWTFLEPDSDQGFAAPVIVGGVAVALGSKALYGIDLSSGKQAWRVARSGGPITEPAVATAGGKTLVLYLDGGLNQQPSKLIAIDAATQKQVWNFALDAASVSGVSVDGSTAFVGDTQGVLYAVDVAKGKETWTSRSTGRIEAPPAVSGGLVYTASRELSQGNATIRAVDENTGQQKWIFAQKQLTSGSAITVADGVAVAGFTDRLARAFDATTGSGDWASLMSSALSPRGSPAASQSSVFVTDLSGTVERFAATTGGRIWSYRFNPIRSLPIPYLVYASSPVVTASNVVIGLGDGRLAAISVATGHLVWESDTGPGALGDLALGDGVLLVSKGGANGGLIAYRHDASGHLLDEASPTELDLARLAGNFAAAFVVILGLVALAGFLLGRVRGLDEPEGART